MKHVTIGYAGVWVEFGDCKGMCETSNDKNVSSEEICFAITSETTAVKSILEGGNPLGIFWYSFKLQKSWEINSEHKETEAESVLLHLN